MSWQEMARQTRLQGVVSCAIIDGTIRRPFTRAVIRDEQGVIVDLRFDLIEHRDQRLDVINNATRPTDLPRLERLYRALTGRDPSEA